jgi:hypothetical protein
MLDSIVAMRSKAILGIFSYLILFISLTAANPFQASFDAKIQSPLPGEAVQGLVQIRGSTFVEGFSSFDLAFSFGNDVTETWFLITQSQSPITDDVIGEWDTSVLSDGNYSLKLTIHRIEDLPIEIIVEGIRVRNYSQIETDTPSKSTNSITPTIIENTPTTIAPVITQSQRPTPTLLTKNPAEIDPKEIQSSIQRGAVISIILLSILGLYAFSRKQH